MKSPGRSAQQISRPLKSGSGSCTGSFSSCTKAKSEHIRIWVTKTQPRPFVLRYPHPTRDEFDHARTCHRFCDENPLPGMGHLPAYQRGNQHKTDLQAALKRIDEEEARVVRLLAAGQISETVWQNHCTEWQDRRNEINAAMHQAELSSDAVIEDLDHALEIFSELETLNNGLGLVEQKDVLRQMVEPIVINNEGKLLVELRSPFAYLQQLSEDMTGLAPERSGMEKQALQRGSALVNAPDEGKRSSDFQIVQNSNILQ